jgi:hypothetical protein
MMDLQWWITVIAVPLIVAIFTVDGAIHAAAIRSAKSCHLRIDALVDKLTGVERENYQWRESAGRTFATSAQFGVLETRLTGALERMDAKLDRLIDRNYEKDRT